MTYPKSKDKKLQKLSNILTAYAESEGVSFIFDNEQEMSPFETFAHFGALSLFLLEAKDTYEKVYNKIYSAEELMQSFGKKFGNLTMDELVAEQEYLESLPKEKIFPIEFQAKSEDTYFGFIPTLSKDLPSDFFTIAHFTHYSVEEYIRLYKKNKMLLVDGKIPLDPLFEKMVMKINTNKVRIIPQNQGLTPGANQDKS